MPMDFRSQIDLPVAAEHVKSPIRKQEFDQHLQSDLHIQNDGQLNQMLVMTSLGPRMMFPKLNCQCGGSYYGCDCRIVFDDNNGGGSCEFRSQNTVNPIGIFNGYGANFITGYHVKETTSGMGNTLVGTWASMGLYAMGQYTVGELVDMANGQTVALLQISYNALDQYAYITVIPGFASCATVGALLANAAIPFVKR